MKLISVFIVCAVFVAPAFVHPLQDSVPPKKVIADTPAVRTVDFRFDETNLILLYEAADNSIQLPLHKKDISADSARKQMEFYDVLRKAIARQLYMWYVEDSLKDAKLKIDSMPYKKKKG